MEYRCERNCSDHGKGIEMTVTEVPVISGGSVSGKNQRCIPRVVGEIEAGVLHDQLEIPRRDYDGRQGYQRPVSPTRVRRLSLDLDNDLVDLPTALLLNIRDFDPERHLRKGERGDVLVIGDTDRFFVVDGQHRLAALGSLIDSEGSGTDAESKWRSFKIPFVCLLGATEAEEMRQFYVVNSTAKSVSTDLAYDLLREQAKQSPGLRKTLGESGDAWKLHGQEIADKLQETPAWRGRIRFPSQKKTKQMTIPSSGMVNSLRELVRGSSPMFEQASLEDQIGILEAYWSGILRVLPEANDNPNDFTLQKMTGAVALHSVLPIVIEILRSEGHSHLDPTAYEEALRNPLEHLEGEARTGEVVRGIDFWRSGADGVAGGYSSNAGRRVIRAKLVSLLPKLNIR